MARLRLSFRHLDNQLKQFIRMKHCNIHPRDIIQLFNNHYQSIYTGIISPGYMDSSYEFQNFSWFANFRIEIDHAFWSKCWSTFIHRFSLEPHILINDSMCQGNRIVDLWVQSIMDNFWLHIHFPEDKNQDSQPVRYGEEEDDNEEDQEDEEEEEEDNIPRYIEPFRIKLHQNQKKTKKKPPSSETDSDVS